MSMRWNRPNRVGATAGIRNARECCDGDNDDDDDADNVVIAVVVVVVV